MRFVFAIALLLLFACGRQMPPKDRSSLHLVDKQIEKIVLEIGEFKEHAIYSKDSMAVSRLHWLRERFRTLRQRSSTGENDSSIIKDVKALYTELGKKYDFGADWLINDIDSLGFAGDKELKLAVNELCLVSRLSNAMMREHPGFRQYNALCLPRGQNTYDVYLAPRLSSDNSSVNFGYFDMGRNEVVQESDPLIEVSCEDDHYIIRNNNPKITRGYIKIKRPDGMFLFFPFEMNGMK